MIDRYVMKPVQAHASQWDGANIKEMQRLLEKTGYDCSIMRAGNVATLIIAKPSAFKALRAELGSYLVRYANCNFEVVSEKDFEDKFAKVKIADTKKKS